MTSLEDFGAAKRPNNMFRFLMVFRYGMVNLHFHVVKVGHGEFGYVQPLKRHYIRDTFLDSFYIRCLVKAPSIVSARYSVSIVSLEPVISNQALCSLRDECNK